MAYTVLNSLGDRDLELNASAKPVCVGKIYKRRYKSVCEADKPNLAFVVHSASKSLYGSDR